MAQASGSWRDHPVDKAMSGVLANPLLFETSVGQTIKARLGLLRSCDETFATVDEPAFA